MKRIVFVILVVALSCIGFTDAKASYYFTFTDTAGQYSLTGTLLTPSNGPGPYQVLAGSSATGTGAANLNILYTYMNPPPGPTTAAWNFDGQLSPESTPALTTGGLVFNSNSDTSSMNIWYENGSYQFGWVLNGANQGPYTLGSGTFTLAPVPIPGAVWLLGSGLLGLVGIGRKRLLK